MHPESKRAAAGPQTAVLEPYAVRIPTASHLLGDKAHSIIYELLGLGKLRAIKDGTKTLITLDSIREYQASLPPAKIKPPAARRPRQQTPDRKRGERKS